MGNISVPQIYSEKKMRKGTIKQMKTEGNCLI